MAGVVTWMDDVDAVSYEQRWALQYSAVDKNNEAEIGKIFDADGGPQAAQDRVQSYLLGRGVNDQQVCHTTTSDDSIDCQSEADGLLMNNDGYPRRGLAGRNWVIRGVRRATLTVQSSASGNRSA